MRKLKIVFKLHPKGREGNNWAGIDWGSRLRNKAFWSTAISASLLLIQAAMSLFGFRLVEVTGFPEVIDAVNAVLSVLVCLGVISDPRTDGFGDEGIER